MPVRITHLLRPLSVMIFLCWLLLSGKSHAAGDGFVSVGDLQSAAVSFARTASPDGAAIEAASLDSRLRLPACAEPLQASAASQSLSGMSVEVRCASAGWRLNVPVTVRVQVGVLVARRMLARGDSISAADVEVQSRDRASLGTAWIASIGELDGKVAARPIAAGAVLASNSLVPVRLVRRGQSVLLVGDAGGFQVRAEGKALGDAAAGDLLSVENSSSRRVVQGRVRADGSVAVRL